MDILLNKNEQLEKLLSAAEIWEKQMQKNLGKLLDKILHESSSYSVQHIYRVVYCDDLETWDGDIWYSDDDL